MPFYIKVRQDKKNKSLHLAFINDGTGYSSYFKGSDTDLSNVDLNELSLELTAKLNFMLGSETTKNDEV